ncbi:MAG: tetratricopeptide repeat protein [Verrucomicrobiae bacterium]|nr:tetratricopeptide repeat protein [Verrucomicrobiae bacterium]
MAPIIFKQCGTCHHPDGSGPFSLLTYEDVRKRARQIGEVTRSRYMPPWLPAHGYGEFIGERRLSDDEIETIGSWVSSGAVEGAPADLPPVPQWPGGWQLGEPDLILKIPEPYTLAAEGRDVYRQFVLPTGLTTSRYVRATEIRPGNPKIAHHAIINLDPTGYAAKQEDEKDSPPGFDGMGLSDGHGLESPGGQYIVWTPGMIADGGSADMAWTLEPGTDLVLEIHMAPSGKPEVIQPVVGLYFSDQPPTKYPVQLRLDPSPIDIPAGESEYSVTDSMVLPVDVELLAIFPHAHYLCKVMKCVAVLPDGKRKWLLNIPDWDFDWQDDYTYAEPVLLPSGTTVSMEFIYDNSAENPHNPNDPPRRVLEGPQSTDEMSNVSLQFLPQSPGDGQQLKELYWRRGIQRVPGYYYAHFAAGVHSMVQGKFAQARVDYENCLALNPQFIQARFNLAHVYLQLKEFDLAILQYQSVLGSDPGNALAHSNLGRIFDQKRDPSRAATHYRRAIENDPNLFEPHNRLGVILARQGSYSEAAKLFARAVQINPDHSLAHVNLANAYLLQKQYALAITHYNEALRIDPKDKEAQTNLSRARAALKTN